MRTSQVVQPPTRRVIFGVAVAVESVGEPPDRVDLWRLEEQIASNLESLFEAVSRSSVAVVVSSPEIGDAPEWLLERASDIAVARLARQP
jgi:hypothetical protein